MASRLGGQTGVGVAEVVVGSEFEFAGVDADADVGFEFVEADAGLVEFADAVGLIAGIDAEQPQQRQLFGAAVENWTTVAHGFLIAVPPLAD